MGKTPSYIKDAVDNYRKKFDLIQIRFPLGTKEDIINLTGQKVNDYVTSLVAADLKERKVAAALEEYRKKQQQKTIDSVFDAINPPDPAPCQGTQEIRIPGMTPEQIAEIDFRRLKSDVLYQLEVLDLYGEKAFDALSKIAVPGEE